MVGGVGSVGVGVIGVVVGGRWKVGVGVVVVGVWVGVGEGLDGGGYGGEAIAVDCGGYGGGAEDLGDRSEFGAVGALVLAY